MVKGVLAIGFFATMLNSANIDVPCINQSPKYPTGCESVATVEVLNSYGHDITVDKFIDTYVDRIDINDPKVKTLDNVFDAYFVGNPYTKSGLLCNAPVVARAIEKYAKDNNISNLTSVDYTGVSFDVLLNEVAKGTPVIIWVTIGYVEPIKGLIGKSEYGKPSHAVLLTGYDLTKGEVYLVDSIQGKVTQPYTKVKDIYTKMGKKGFVIKES